MPKQTRIILIDADVVSHFIYAGELDFISKIFPNKIVILDKVYGELSNFKRKITEVERLVKDKIIEVLPFPEENEIIKKEYAHIRKVMFKGEGESACLAFVAHTQDIIASSNLKDIANYCRNHSIDYLSTMDFLCEALRIKLFDINRCNSFISKVLQNKNKLPVTKIEDHICRPIDFL